MLESYAHIDLPSQQPLIRRVTKKPILEHYNRLVIFVAMINLSLLIYGISFGHWWNSQSINLSVLSNLILGNFFVAIIFRQQYVINFLFWIATRASTNWPLFIRWNLAKVYHFGGLHSSCAISGSLWFTFYTITIGYYFYQQNPAIPMSLIQVSCIILILLVTMIIMAMPKMRSRFHDHFELVHRFAGWSILLLFWLQTLIISNLNNHTDNIISKLIHSHSFWMLIIMTSSVILPWIRLRKVPVEIEKPSSHVALVKFNHGVTPFAGSSTAISRNPFVEWHSFANVPSPGEKGFRLTISRAGDWTGSFIDDLPSHVWVKGIPTAGVANIETLFKRVIYVATGSGIGPCLPHLLAELVPAKLVWSTRSPRKTYGDKLVDEILAVQPDAIIWDTAEYGKPDMVRLTYAAYKDFDAEAVICIANQKLTREVVYGMESRGIPAYGAIWDS